MLIKTELASGIREKPGIREKESVLEIAYTRFNNQPHLDGLHTSMSLPINQG